MKDFYWDIRPKPEFGTIEMRVCDTPLTVERAAALAGYLQALCRYLLRASEPFAPTEDDYLVYTYNRFQACRFGLDGEVVHPKTYEPLPLREDIIATLGKVRRTPQALGSVAALEHLEVAARDGGDASFLRKRRTERGSARRHGRRGDGAVPGGLRAVRGPCASSLVIPASR